MAKKVYVTRAQKHAAEMIVERSAKSGRVVRSGVSKIAGASVNAHNRSAITGRFVTAATAKRHPNTTVTENSSSAPKSTQSPSGKK